jgi:PhnB protein
MKTSINPYLNFDGNCREAMEFYKDCFGGEIEMQTVEGSPMEKYLSGSKDQVLHATLSNGSLVLMGSDIKGPGYAKGGAVILSLTSSSEEELNRFFTKLSRDGQVIDQIRPMFWGALCGALLDKYGMRWMMNYPTGNNN